MENKDFHSIVIFQTSTCHIPPKDFSENEKPCICEVPETVNDTSTKKSDWNFRVPFFPRCAQYDKIITSFPFCTLFCFFSNSSSPSRGSRMKKGERKGRRQKRQFSLLVPSSSFFFISVSIIRLEEKEWRKKKIFPSPLSFLCEIIKRKDEREGKKRAKKPLFLFGKRGGAKPCMSSNIVILISCGERAKEVKDSRRRRLYLCWFRFWNPPLTALARFISKAF